MIRSAKIGKRGAVYKLGSGDRFLVKYYRLSLEDRNSGESDSIVNQRSLIEEYIKEHADLRDMESVELSDDGYTGTNFNRPGIKKLFEMLRKNQIGCVIVKDFSRFSRDYIELGNYVEQVFPFMEVRFIAINDNYDSLLNNQGNGLDIPFKGILNDLYSKDISMKVKAAKRQMIKNGRLCSGSYPFGYQKVEKGQKGQGNMPYMIDEDAAEIVRYIFKLALEGKKNIEIARILNEKKYPTRGSYKRLKGGFGYGLEESRESIWDSSKVLDILRDERYKGTLILGRYQSAGVGSGKVMVAPEESWFRKDNAIPAIISEEDFDAVQAMHPYKERGKYSKEHHLLYRKVRCGCCGRYLYFKPSESGEQYHSFFCKQSHLNRESKCFKAHIKEKDILEMLLCLIQKQVELAGEIKRNTRKQTGTENSRIERQLKNLEKEIEVRQAAKAQNYMEYKDGGITKEEFLERKGEIQKEIAEKENQAETLRKTKGEIVDGESEFVEILSGYKKIEKIDRGIIEELVDTVWVYDVGRVKVEWKFNNNLLSNINATSVDQQ